MDFTIRPGQPVGTEVKRILAEQVDSAVTRLRDPGSAGAAVAVHEARKSCKRLRAVFRLVRPTISASRYRSLNAAVRDAARELSPARDAHALVAMFDDLAKAHGIDPDGGELSPARAALVDRAETVAHDGEGDGALVRALERLELVGDTIARTRIEGRDFRVLRKGLEATYRDGRRAFAEFEEERSPHLSHEWRKSVKYTWHHVELLEQAAPSLLAPVAEGLHSVSDALGDAHNLTVLIDLVLQAPARFGGLATAERLSKLASESRNDLEDRAVRLARRLYAERPREFTRRIRAYWRAAQLGAVLPTGELSDVAPASRAENEEIS